MPCATKFCAESFESVAMHKEQRDRQTNMHTHTFGFIYKICSE